jgi:hypothetical protein
MLNPKMKSKWGRPIKKNKDGVDLHYFWKCRHFKNTNFPLINQKVSNEGGT